MKTRHRGFTLPELVVVVVIAGVVAAIFMPRAGRASQRALAVKCQVNMRNFYQGMPWVSGAANSGAVLPCRTRSAGTAGIAEG